MKDIWNKCLGWITLTGEFIVDGLFLRCPDLIEIVGKTTAELFFDMMIGLIDKAVRALDERTEVVARESYHSVPLSRSEDITFKTLEEGFEQFAHLGIVTRYKILLHGVICYINSVSGIICYISYTHGTICAK